VKIVSFALVILGMVGLNVADRLAA
jgi:hypothetical protein